MKTNPKAPLFCVMILSAGSMLIAADDTPTTQPTPEHHRTSNRLVKPWSDITTLTDDQKIKIEKIHADSNEAQRAIRDKEQKDIEALLTDDQKAQLKSTEADEAAQRKERAAKKKTEETEVMPTTAP